jgi:polysaccharide pyruvyl transferase WcaK-like protein
MPLGIRSCFIHGKAAFMAHLPILMHGNNFDSNRGCQAIRLTTQMILDRYLPDYPRWYANIFCNDDPQFLTHEPDPRSIGQIWETYRRGTPSFYVWGAKLIGFRFWQMFPAMKVNAALDRATALLALGGDNLSYDYGFLATLLFLSPFHAAVRKGVPSVIWGASIGPFSKRPRWERRFAHILRRVDLITVRESITQSYLDELGVRDNVRRVTDPAFLLPTDPVELPDEIEQVLQAGAIGLNLAPLMTRYNRLSSQAWTQKALELLKAVRGVSTRPIILIPHVMMSPYTFPDNDDYQFMQSLLHAMAPNEREGIFLYDARCHSSKQIKWLVSQLRLFIGSRLHATVAALSSCVPTFCIGYSIKSRGIFRDIFGHERWVVHVADLSAEQLATRIQSLLDEESAVRDYLKSFIPGYADAAWKAGEFLQQMLRERGRLS